MQTAGREGSVLAELVGMLDRSDCGGKAEELGEAEYAVAAGVFASKWSLQAVDGDWQLGSWDGLPSDPDRVEPRTTVSVALLGRMILCPRSRRLAGRSWV